MYVPDGTVNNTVVCKETSRTVRHSIRKVVYIEEEKNRPQDSALGHSRYDAAGARCSSLQDNSLRSVGEEGCYPL